MLDGLDVLLLLVLIELELVLTELLELELVLIELLLLELLLISSMDKMRMRSLAGPGN